MRSIFTMASAATFAVMASAGLARPAPQPVRRGDLDLSSPYIPPARPKATKAQKLAANERMAKAETKRARKAARYRELVAKGAIGAI